MFVIKRKKTWNRLKYCENRFASLDEDFHNVVSELKKYKSKFEDCEMIIKQLCEKLDDGLNIIAVKKNKHNEYILVEHTKRLPSTLRNDVYGSLYLYNSCQNLSIGRLFYEFNENKNTIGIVDIQSSDSNRGNASIMLEILLQVATTYGATRIFGMLSSAGPTKTEKLIHFYKKHGFEVTLLDEPQGFQIGRIRKQLQPVSQPKNMKD